MNFPNSDIDNISDWLISLKIQRRRILRAASLWKNSFKKTASKRNNLHHDADFYIILLRRLYNILRKYAKINSEIANLKGKEKYRAFDKKTSIRNLLEHFPGWEKFPNRSPRSQLKIQMGIKVNSNGIFIDSANQTWDLKKDHKPFTELMQILLKLVKQNK